MARLTPPKKAWFDVPNDPDKARVEIVYINPGEERDIQDAVELYETSLKPDAAGKMQREVKVNAAKGDKRYAFVCAAVANWENFFGLDGQPMDCTDANKILVARDDDTFGPFVGECRTQLAEIVKTEREAARKNS